MRLILMDMEFEKIKDDFDKVELNTTAAREHVGEIERGIRFLKERSRCVISDLRVAGFQYFAKWIVVHCVYFVVMMVNAIPAEDGISEKLSPREIVTGRTIDFVTDCRAMFGAYVEASYDHIVTNTMSERRHACVCLGPSGNLQGSIKCLDLMTGKVVRRRTFDVLPYPDRVLKLVNAMGKMGKVEKYGNKLKFLNRHKAKFDWDNDDLEEDIGLVEPSHAAHPGILAEVPGVELESDSDDVTTAIQAVPTPSLADRAKSARENANLGSSTGVPNAKVRGVYETEVVTIDEERDEEEDAPPLVRPEDNDSDSSDSEDEDDDLGEVEAEEVIVEDVDPDEDDASSEEEHNPDEEDIESLVHQLGSPRRGRGRRQKVQRTHYVPQSAEFTGVSNQQLGVLNLSYRGQKYHLKEGVISLNFGREEGVAYTPTQYTNGVINLNID